MALSNPGWVGYFDRTYDQIKANVLTKFQALVPEITDHTETNPWVKGVSIWSALIELIGYYVDSNAREVYITTAKEFASAVKIAKLFDYRVKGAVPAGVTLRFTSNIAATGNITIPIGTVVSASSGEIFTTTTVGIILTGTTYIDVQAKQWEAVVNVALGNSNGAADQQFVLEEDVADGSVSITVSVDTYNAVDTFAYSFTDSKDFISGLQEDTKMRVLFGDGLNGKIPPSGNSITANYFITLGLSGNVGAGKITTIVSSITVPGAEIISVNNAQNATGGADFESLTKLAKRVPLSIHTRYRAVTPQDFIDVTELFSGVEKAGVNFDCDIDKYVHIYIVPDGGGVAAPSLITDTTAFLELRKIITTLLDVESAGLVGLKITVNVTAIPGFSNSQVQTNVINALVAYGESDNQSIEGSAIIGDVYQAIEEADGVLNSVISLIVAIPYARNTTNPTNALDWTRQILAPSAAIQKWQIRFLTNSTFEFYKGNYFIAVYAVDVLVTQAEVSFTVNGNHLAGDYYEFYTYPYNQSVYLQEPSIIGVDAGDLTINVTGGV